MKEDSHLTKFERRPRIFVKLSFRELCDSKLFSLRQKQKTEDRLIVHETTILEVIFVTLTENSSAITNDTEGPQKYPHHLKIAVKHFHARPGTK